jgi:hypothetical protein
MTAVLLVSWRRRAAMRGAVFSVPGMALMQEV